MQDNGVYQFKLFTSHQITTRKLPFDMNKLTKAWTVGRVVDGKQSKNMITINVSIDPVAPEPLEWPCSQFRPLPCRIPRPTSS